MVNQSGLNKGDRTLTIKHMASTLVVLSSTWRAHLTIKHMASKLVVEIATSSHYHPEPNSTPLNTVYYCWLHPVHYCPPYVAHYCWAQVC